MKFYHATPKSNIGKIARDGEIKASWDGCVYLCKNAGDACKFVAVRGVRHMCAIELNIDEKDVEESFDHSEDFFQCKAYAHKGGIALEGTETVYEFEA